LFDSDIVPRITQRNGGIARHSADCWLAYELPFTDGSIGSTPGVDRIGRQFGHLVVTQNHQVAAAGLQFGLAVPVRRSFQLTH
jgi:hypothetical protein